MNASLYSLAAASLTASPSTLCAPIGTLSLQVQPSRFHGHERPCNEVLDDILPDFSDPAAAQKVQNTYTHVAKHWDALSSVPRCVYSPETFPECIPVRLEPQKGALIDLSHIVDGTWKQVFKAALITSPTTSIVTAHGVHRFTAEDKLQGTRRYTMAKKELEIVEQIPPSADRIIHHFFGFETPTCFHFIQEYAQGRALVDLIDQQSLSAKQIDRFARDIIMGLFQLDQLGIVFLDMKPDNVLLTSEFDHATQTWIYGAKICDFGFAFFSKNKTWCPQDGGTCEYIAPEMLGVNPKPQNNKIDTFAYGTTLVMMLEQNASLWHEMPLNTQTEVLTRNGKIHQYVLQLLERKTPLDLFLAKVLDPIADTRYTVVQAHEHMSRLTFHDIESWPDLYTPASLTKTSTLSSEILGVKPASDTAPSPDAFPLNG